MASMVYTQRELGYGCELTNCLKAKRLGSCWQLDAETKTVGRKGRGVEWPNKTEVGTASYLTQLAVADTYVRYLGNRKPAHLNT